MPVGGVGVQQSVQVGQANRSEGAGPIGDGLGGHQAHVGDARGRGIGQMMSQAFETIGKTISNFFAKIGNLFSGRIRNVEQQPPPNHSHVNQLIDTFRSELREAAGMMDLSKESFTEACVQCMSDDTGVQQFLRDNLDNPDFSSEKFTGIEKNPSDPSKFIAKFGEKQLEFSDRGSSNFEFRSEILKGQLSKSSFADLGELIGQNHLTKLDSMLIYSTSIARGNLTSSLENVPEAERGMIKEAVSREVVGNSTFGELFNLSFLD